MKYPQLHDYAYMHHKYVVEQMSIQGTADEVGCSVGAVDYALRKLGIPKRRPGSCGRYPPIQDVEWLREQYITNNRSTRDIALEAGTYRQAVATALRRHGIARPARERSGPVAEVQPSLPVTCRCDRPFGDDGTCAKCGKRVEGQLATA
jgi:hypothetical protein